LTVSGCPKFSAPPSGETVLHIPIKVLEMRPCENVLEVLYHRAKFGVARILPRPKTLSFLFVCLPVDLFATLVNVRVCAHDFAKKAFEYRNDFDAVG